MTAVQGIRVGRRRVLGGLAALLLTACSAGGTQAPSPTTAAPAPSPTAAAPAPSPTVAPASGITPTAAVATVQPTTAPTQAPSPTSPAPTATPIPPTATEAPSATAVPTGPALMTSPDYGVHVFLWGSFDTTERDLSLAREAGFRWIKQRFEWRYIEPHEKGVVSWNEPDRIVEAASRAGLKIIARVDNQPIWARADGLFPDVAPPDNMADFADFVGAMAERYKGLVHAYQIWNEPNLAREWGNRPPNADEYAEMLKVSYEAIKAADPDAIVISAGMSPTTTSNELATPDVEYMKALYAAGAAEHFDMLGAHGAGYRSPPELTPDEIAADPRYNNDEGPAGRIYGFRHIEDMRAIMVENGDEAKRVAVLEFGWTSDNRPESPYEWHSVSEEEKARYLVGAFEVAKANWQPWIGVMTVIYIADPLWTPDHEQYYWSITNPDGTLRPAYTALQNMPKD